MTTEEIEAIESRLAAGRDAKRKVDRITEAIKQINDGNVERLNLAIKPKYNGNDPIFYSADSDAKTSLWTRVCWGKDELPGLGEEIHEAVKAILGRRLTAAIEDFQRI